MLVRELAAYLRDFDPDAEVRVVACLPLVDRAVRVESETLMVVTYDGNEGTVYIGRDPATET